VGGQRVGEAGEVALGALGGTLVRGHHLHPLIKQIKSIRSIVVAVWSVFIEWFACTKAATEE